MSHRSRTVASAVNSTVRDDVIGAQLGDAHSCPIPVDDESGVTEVVVSFHSSPKQRLAVISTGNATQQHQRRKATTAPAVTRASQQSATRTCHQDVPSLSVMGVNGPVSSFEWCAESKSSSVWTTTGCMNAALADVPPFGHPGMPGRGVPHPQPNLPSSSVADGDESLWHSRVASMHSLNEGDLGGIAGSTRSAAEPVPAVHNVVTYEQTIEGSAVPISEERPRRSNRHRSGRRPRGRSGPNSTPGQCPARRFEVPLPIVNFQLTRWQAAPVAPGPMNSTNLGSQAPEFAHGEPLMLNRVASILATPPLGPICPAAPRPPPLVVSTSAASLQPPQQHYCGRVFTDLLPCPMSPLAARSSSIVQLHVDAAARNNFTQPLLFEEADHDEADALPRQRTEGVLGSQNLAMGGASYASFTEFSQREIVLQAEDDQEHALRETTASQVQFGKPSPHEALAAPLPSSHGKPPATVVAFAHGEPGVESAKSHDVIRMAAFTDTGPRAAQEDTYCYETWRACPDGADGNAQIHYGAVFDGHGGGCASQYASSHVHRHIQRYLACHQSTETSAESGSGCGHERLANALVYGLRAADVGLCMAMMNGTVSQSGKRNEFSQPQTTPAAPLVGSGISGHAGTDDDDGDCDAESEHLPRRHGHGRADRRTRRAKHGSVVSSDDSVARAACARSTSPSISRTHEAQGGIGGAAGVNPFGPGLARFPLSSSSADRDVDTDGPAPCAASSGPQPSALGGAEVHADAASRTTSPIPLARRRLSLGGATPVVTTPAGSQRHRGAVRHSKRSRSRDGRDIGASSGGDDSASVARTPRAPKSNEQQLAPLLPSPLPPLNAGPARLPVDAMSVGTTALLMLCDGRSVTIANLGDSRAVMCLRRHDAAVAPCVQGAAAAGYQALELTRDQKASCRHEQSRIEATGESVIDGRVRGDLEVSRALGDFQFKDFRAPPQVASRTPRIRGGSGLPPLSPTPAPASVATTAHGPDGALLPDRFLFGNTPVTNVAPAVEFPLDDKVMFVLLATDGLWDVMSSSEVVAFVVAGMFKAATTPPPSCHGSPLGYPSDETLVTSGDVESRRGYSDVDPSSTEDDAARRCATVPKLQFGVESASAVTNDPKTPRCPLQCALRALVRHAVDVRKAPDNVTVVAFQFQTFDK